MTQEKRALVSFSGGRSSAMMMYLVSRSSRYDQVLYVFANTGQEAEETLNFVHQCGQVWGIEIHWVEAAVRPGRGQGTKHRAVGHNSAERGDRLFADMCAKFGIPNSNYPHCTRELKERPLTSFVREHGWPAKSYDTLIGIRADEIDRMHPKADEIRFRYPLIRAGIKKPDVSRFWGDQPFRLNLPEHRGNCLWCWKKSFKKLYTLAQEDPSIFEIPARLEERFSENGPGERRLGMFRGGRNTSALLKEAREFTGDRFEDPEFSAPSACGEICEAFSAEYEPEDIFA